jgi:hypothetical protein
MNQTDKQIVETYAGLFEGLRSLNKIELIKSLSKSLKNEKKTKDSNFLNRWGFFFRKISQRNN